MRFSQDSSCILVLLSGVGCEVRSAEHVAYLNMIIRKKFLSPSPLCDEVLRMRLPSVDGLEGIELGNHEKLAILCRKILHRTKPGHLAHQCYHLLVQHVQLFEIRLWLHVRAKDDDDHRCAPLQLRTCPHQDTWLLHAPGGTTSASRPASAAWPPEAARRLETRVGRQREATLGAVSQTDQARLQRLGPQQRQRLPLLDVL